MGHITGGLSVIATAKTPRITTVFAIGVVQRYNVWFETGRLAGHGRAGIGHHP